MRILTPAVGQMTLGLLIGYNVNINPCRRPVGGGDARSGTRRHKDEDRRQNEHDERDRSSRGSQRKAVGFREVEKTEDGTRREGGAVKGGLGQLEEDGTVRGGPGQLEEDGTVRGGPGRPEEDGTVRDGGPGRLEEEWRRRQPVGRADQRTR
jgi:hypothetical protein